MKYGCNRDLSYRSIPKQTILTCKLKFVWSFMSKLFPDGWVFTLAIYYFLKKIKSRLNFHYYKFLKSKLKSLTRLFSSFMYYVLNSISFQLVSLYILYFKCLYNKSQVKGKTGPKLSFLNDLRNCKNYFRVDGFLLLRICLLQEPP